MKAVRVNFLGEDATIDFNDMVEGFWPTVQNCTVAIGQKRGSDSIYPAKGSDMQPGESNYGDPFAMESTLVLLSVKIATFTNEHDVSQNEHKLKRLKLNLAQISQEGISIEVNADSILGESIKTTI
jgi:hypothetical protein